MTTFFSQGTNLERLPTEELKSIFNQSIRGLQSHVAVEKTGEDVPSEQMSSVQRPTVTLGDMHGNTLNFIHKLIAMGVLIPPEGEETACYQELCEAYDALGDSSNGKISTLIKKFQNALGRMSCNPVVDLDLIGDLVGDRGANDLLTFYVLKKLKEAGVKYVINASNHGFAFIAEYEGYKSGRRANSGINQRGQMNSSNALFSYMNNNPDIEEEVDTLYKNVYSSHLVLASLQYDKAEKALNISAHAPITMMTLFAAASYYELDSTLIERAQDSFASFVEMVNALNLKFQEDLQTSKITEKNKPLSEASLMGLPVHYSYGNYPAISSSEKDALGQMTWNRTISSGELREHAKTVRNLCKRWGLKNVTFTHGHTGPEGGPGDLQGIKRLQSGCHYNIDSNLGKLQGSRFNKGVCCATIAGPLVTPAQLNVEPNVFAREQKPSATTYHLKLRSSPDRTVVDTWLGGSGLLLMVGGSIAFRSIMPVMFNYIMSATDVLRNIINNPAACIALSVLAIGVGLAVYAAISLKVRKQSPVFFKPKALPKLDESHSPSL